jgi:hypothetical protein
VRRVVQRTARPSKRATDLSRRLLQQADEIWRSVSGLDTAVRDSVADGLAYIVNAAYDTASFNERFFPDTESWLAWIEQSTAKWFRDRGFAEWYCAGAANLFHHSRPRIKAEAPFIIRRHRRKKGAA